MLENRKREIADTLAEIQDHLEFLGGVEQISGSSLKTLDDMTAAGYLNLKCQDSYRTTFNPSLNMEPQNYNSFASEACQCHKCVMVHVSQPDRPAAQPDHPPAQPYRPPAQPDRPPAQPDRPSAQPYCPPAQPYCPPAQPYPLPAQLARPPAQPYLPPAQPARSLTQPARPPAHPYCPTAQPYCPTEQPYCQPVQAALPVRLENTLEAAVNYLNYQKLKGTLLKTPEREYSRLFRAGYLSCVQHTLNYLDQPGINLEDHQVQQIISALTIF